MTQQKIVMPLKKLAFSSISSVERPSRSSKYLRILAHAPSNTTCKTEYFNIWLQRTDCWHFHGVGKLAKGAVCCSGHTAIAKLPRWVRGGERSREKRDVIGGTPGGGTAIGICNVLCSYTSLSILAMIMQVSKWNMVHLSCGASSFCNKFETAHENGPAVF